jgi:hypothetical protein
MQYTIVLRFSVNQHYCKFEIEVEGVHPVVCMIFIAVKHNFVFY